MTSTVLDLSVITEVKINKNSYPNQNYMPGRNSINRSTELTG